MKNISLKFLSTGRIGKYQLSDNIADIKPGCLVLAEDEGIVEIGQVIGLAEEQTEVKEKILKKFDRQDREKMVKLKEEAKEYLVLCQEKIQKHGLGAMKLLDADLSFDEKKLTFYFGAEGRVDFRELVADLARTFKKTIRLQQIGSRDEARLFGGFGPCGRPLCCKNFLKSSPSITLDMAKKQEMAATASKLSGLCGKLMCCLAYERESYEEMSKNMPEIGSIIKIGKDQGKVIARNILRQTVVIENEGKRKELKINK